MAAPTPVPTREQFLDAARTANPDRTEAELTDYYDRTYGPAKPEESHPSDPGRTLPSWPEFHRVAKEANPHATDAELHTYWEDEYGTKGASPTEPGGSDMARGFKKAMQQVPQLAHGIEAGVGAAIEKVEGEGGVGTGLLKHGAKKYQEWGETIAKDQKTSDEFRYAYDRATHGDFHALTDWIQYGLGYTGGQALQMLATAGIGSVVGKQGLQTAAKTLAQKLVDREAAAIAAKSAAALTAEEIAKQATANVAARIGQYSAMAVTATGMEGGEIFGDLTSKKLKEGQRPSGEELAKAFGWSVGAGALEFAGDALGLNLLLGKTPLNKIAHNVPGLKGRLLRGGAAALADAITEGGTEYLQTLMEAAGKGEDPFSDATKREAIESAALGTLGGAAVGGTGGVVNAPVQNLTAPSKPDIRRPATSAAGEPPTHDEVAALTSQHSTVDQAIEAAMRLVDKPALTPEEIEKAIDSQLGTPTATAPESTATPAVTPLQAEVAKVRKKKRGTPAPESPATAETTAAEERPSSPGPSSDVTIQPPSAPHAESVPVEQPATRTAPIETPKASTEKPAKPTKTTPVTTPITTTTEPVVKQPETVSQQSAVISKPTTGPRLSAETQETAPSLEAKVRYKGMVKHLETLAGLPQDQLQTKREEAAALTKMAQALADSEKVNLSQSQREAIRKRAMRLQQLAGLVETAATTGEESAQPTERPAPLADEVAKLKSTQKSSGPTPPRTLNIFRGKHGAVKVTFPSQAHADLFSFSGRLKRHVAGEKTFDTEASQGFIRSHLKQPDLNVGSASIGYKQHVMEAIKNLPHGATFEAPAYHESMRGITETETKPAPAETVTPVETTESKETPRGKVWQVLWADGRGVQYFSTHAAAEQFSKDNAKKVSYPTLIDRPKGAHVQEESPGTIKGEAPPVEQPTAEASVPNQESAAAEPEPATTTPQEPEAPHEETLPMGGPIHIVDESLEAELVKRMKQRLVGRLSSNPMFDPQLMSDGMRLGAIYAQQGANKFLVWATKMLGSLGEGIRPYLRAIWASMRVFPRDLPIKPTTAVSLYQYGNKLYNEGLTDRQAFIDKTTKVFGRVAVPYAEAVHAALSSFHNPSLADQQAMEVLSKQEAPHVTSDQPTRGPVELRPYDEGASPASSAEAGPSVPRGGETGFGNAEAGHASAREHGGPHGERPELGSGMGTPAGPALSTLLAGPVTAKPPAIDHDTGGRDYVITARDLLALGGPKEKFRRNLAAIELLHQLEVEGRPAKPDEQAVLVQYTGWGGLSQAFEGDWRRDWRNEYQQLQNVLTPEEREAAQSSTQYAHYTDPSTINGIYAGLLRMGISSLESPHVLEPSLGVGHFFGVMPVNLAQKASRSGIEIDNLSGRIAKQLYQRANIQIAPFEDVTLPGSFFDLAVGNVPFSQVKIADLKDKELNRLNLSTHNYFFAKALKKVRPGGIVAFITSTGTMDNINSRAREYLASQANLIAAFRLPNTTFQGIAATQVTTDIVILQKRKAGDPATGETWTATVPMEVKGGTATINEYFKRHPEHMLGTPSMGGTMYGGRLEFSLEPDGRDYASILHEAMQALPENIIKPYERNTGASDNQMAARLPAPGDVKPGAYTVVDGKLYMKDGEELVQQPATKQELERVQGLIHVRDAVREVFTTQLHDRGTEEDAAAISEARRDLNKAYDKFIKKHGYINDRANALAYLEDPDYPLLQSLEHYTKATGSKKEGTYKEAKATKAAIFTKRTIERNVRANAATSPLDALHIALSEENTINWNRMAELTGSTPAELQDALKGQVYRTPEGEWETADAYLSGNVKRKLAEAQAAAKMKPVFEENVRALEAVQPIDLTTAQIEARLGAGWVPVSDMEDFVAALFGGKATVRYSEAIGAWSVSDLPRWASLSHENTRTWGTPRMSGHSLLMLALNSQQATVYDKVPDGKSVVNEKETLAAREKMQAIKDRFTKWIWEDEKRAARLARLYNDQFNHTVNRKYDGSHLTLPGKNQQITLRPHQLSGVYRALQNGNTLLAHEVGTGKTFTMAAIAMESRRLRLAKKPLITVPKHLVEYWDREFRRLYPAANVLMTTPEDFSAKNRAKLQAKIATGDWDLVVTSHNQLAMLPISKSSFQSFMKEQIDTLEEFIRDEAEKGGKKSRLVKDLERAKKRLESRLKKRMAEKEEDNAVTFEETGVDLLLVDEADLFKNLFYPTRMTRVAGLPNSESQRAFDMYLKTQYLTKLHNGRGVIFGTGTPISNSMSEMFTMMRYLQSKDLDEMGLSHFDAWARQFGEAVTSIGMNATGKYITRTRFSKFINVPDLMTIHKKVMDVQFAEQVGIARPPMRTGKPINVVSKPGETLKKYVATLQQRADHLAGVDPRVDNMLKIVGDGRHAALDVRLRVPGAPDDPNGKINKMVEEVAKLYKESTPYLGTQLIFLDLSTPKVGQAVKEAAAVPDSATQQQDETDQETTEEHQLSQSVYEQIRTKLVRAGVKLEDIAFIHEAQSGEQKARLFEKVNAGQLRVLLGSTEKLGAGTNVQQRLIAAHSLDAPWRPRDQEQRDGRINRQGNQLYEYSLLLAKPADQRDAHEWERLHALFGHAQKHLHGFEIGIYHYATAAPSFDLYMWQMLEDKAKTINQIMRGDASMRSIDDVDMAVMSASEMKAAASGNPMIVEKVGLEQELRRLTLLRSQHQDTARVNKKLMADLPTTIKNLEEEITKATDDMTVRDAHPDDPFTMTVGKETYTDKEKAGQALMAAVKDVPINTPSPIGSYRGFDLTLFTYKDIEKDAQGTPVVLIQGDVRMRRQGGLRYDGVVRQSAAGAIQSMNSALSKIDAFRASRESELALNQKKLKQLEESSKEGFDHDERITFIQNRLNEIDLALGIGQADVNAVPEDAATKGDEGRGDTDEDILDEGVAEEEAAYGSTEPEEGPAITERVTNKVARAVAKRKKGLRATHVETMVDVGEKIGGARKDLWAGRHLRLSDLEHMMPGEESKYVTKVNIWDPDYAQMVQSGAEPETVARIKLIYDQLAQYPKDDTPEGRRAFLSAMEKVRVAFQDVKSETGFDAALSSINDSLTHEERRTVRKPNLRTNPFYDSYEDQRRAKQMVEDGFPNQEPWQRLYKVDQYYEPNNTYAPKRYAEDVLSHDAYKRWLPEGTTKEDLEQQFKAGGVWRVKSTRFGTVAYVPSRERAVEVAKAIYEEKKGQKNEEKMPERPHLDKIVREGQNYRNGKDVTAEDFREAFGFRGVEFGNWAASDERQKHVNQAYDALNDLSDLLGIPPAAISLNGTLGLAFGARGIGNFAAHYEPSKLVINITKLRGPGSLAHEWGHALDHYFGEVGKERPYQGSPTGISGYHEKPRWSFSVKNPNLRPEMQKAFEGLMQSLYERKKDQAEEVRNIELSLESEEASLKRVEDDEKAELAKPSDEQSQGTLRWAKNAMQYYQRRLTALSDRLAKVKGEPEPEEGYGTQKSSFYDMAEKLSGSTGDYWKRPTEMFARSFEAYIHDKLGRKSQYLVHSVAEDAFGKGYRGNPYPAGVERKQINAAYDKVFETMRFEPTDKGMALMEPEASYGNTKLQREVNLAKFMAGSKVVTKEGRPKVVYHGSPNVFEQFHMERVSSPGGFWFVEQPRYSDRYTQGSGSIYPVYLSIKHPAPMEKFYEADEAQPYDQTHAERNAGIQRYLMARGYDGIRMTQGDAVVWVAFRPTQIKSASGNRGTFDLHNPSIAMEREKLYAGRGENLTPGQRMFQNQPKYGVRQEEPAETSRARAQDALGDLDRAADTVSSLGGGLARSGRAGSGLRTTGLGFTPDLIKTGRVDLRGQTITDSASLAKLAQLYRDPRFETFRIFYTNDAGTIVGHEGLTARLPNAASPWLPLGKDIMATHEAMAQLPAYEGDVSKKLRARMFEPIRLRMKRMGATGYYLLHNHPSGDPTASRQDIAVTGLFRKEVPGFQGHVIIDSNQYAVIDRALVARRHALSQQVPDRLLHPSIDHPILGTPIDDPETAARLGKFIQVPDHYVTLVYLDALHKVRAIQEVPVGLFLRRREMEKYLRGRAREFGSTVAVSYFGRHDRGDVNSAARSYMRSGHLMDHVNTNANETSIYLSDATTMSEGEAARAKRNTAKNIAGTVRVEESEVSYRPKEASRQALFTIPELSGMDTVIRVLEDKHIDLRRMVDAIKQAGLPVKAETNPVLHSEMYAGRVTKRTEDFINNELRPLIQFMRLNKITLDQLDQYLHARHAEEANAHLQAINPDREDNTALSGMTNEEAARILEAAPPAMKRLSEKVDAMIAKTRQTLVDYGLETTETVKEWAEQYRHYVPLMREGFDEGGPMGTGQGFSVRGPSSKSRTGSTRSVVDILANVALQREKAIVRGEKMRPVIALAGMLMRYPNKRIASLAKRIQMKYTDPQTGLIVKTGGDTGDYRVPTIKTINKEGVVEYRPDPNYKGRDNVVNFRIQGKDYAIVFNEQDPRAMEIAKGLKDLDTAQANAVFQKIAPVTRYLASINTQYNPVFGLTNFTRDLQFALLALSSTPLAPYRKEIIGNVVPALRGVYRAVRADRAGHPAEGEWAKLWEQFSEVGGPTGYRELYKTSADRAHAIEQLLDPDWWLKTKPGKVVSMGGLLAPMESVFLEKSEPLFDWLSDYNQTLENAVRLSVFKAGLAHGLPTIEAASLAKNITVNFNKKGQVAPTMGALFAFFNASVQGSARLAETLFEKGKVGTLTTAGKRIVQGGLMLGALQAVILSVFGFDGDDPPEWIKAKKLIIPVPGTDRGYLSIPMPLGFNLIPTIGRLATEAVLYGRPMERMYDMLAATLDAFSPVGTSASIAQTITPTVAKPIVALAENKDWTGKPISREDVNSLAPTPGFSRTRNTASPWAILLSEAINALTGGTDYKPGEWSPTPDAIDYLIGYATGGIGREVGKLAQAVAAPARGEELPIYKIPVVGTFVGSASDTAATRERFYRNIRELNLHELELKGRRANREDMAGYLREHPEAKLIETGNMLEREIQLMNKRKRDLIKRGASHDQIQAVEDRIIARMHQLNTRLYQMEAR